MTPAAGSDGPDDLNFDRVEAGSGTENAAPNRCANCGNQTGATYHTVNGAPICSSCRAGLQEAAAPVRSPAMLGRAIAFGFGAAIVGAAIYYAVMRYLNLEIGLVAILTGWMVGKAMNRSTAGRGGRLLQMSAGVLTYVSIAMAYFPFAFQQANATGVESSQIVPEGSTRDPAANAGDSSAAVAPRESSADTELSDQQITAITDDDAGNTNPFAALALVAGFAFILPILVIVDSMPGGLISAAIIGFGIMQAWQLTAAPKLTFEGPFRLARSAGDNSSEQPQS